MHHMAKPDERSESEQGNSAAKPSPSSLLGSQEGGK
jgi:hypothetical protein